MLLGLFWRDTNIILVKVVSASFVCLSFRKSSKHKVEALLQMAMALEIPAPLLLNVYTVAYNQI